MIIALSADKTIINIASKLHTLFQQKEIALELEDIIRRNYNLSNFDNNSTERITILGHAHSGLYAGMDAETFTQHLINIFETNEKTSPGFIENLDAIDLIGCELGFVSSSDTSFALEVANLLYDKGYELPIHAFTEERYRKNHYYHTITLYNFELDFEEKPSYSWSFYGLQTQQDMQNFQACGEKINQIQTQKDEKRTELYALIEAEHTLRANNTALRQTLVNSNAKMKTIKSKLRSPEEKTMYAELHLQWREGVTQRKNKMTKNFLKIQELLQTQMQTSNDIEVLEKQQQTSTQQLLSYATLIGATNHPREYFASHPECNFMQLAQLKSQLSTAKTTKETELHAVIANIQTLEVENIELQLSIETANSTMEAKKIIPRSLEEDDEFTQLELKWQKGVAKRQIKIMENSGTIRELLQTQQQIAKDITEISRRLAEFSETRQPGATPLRSKPNTVKIARQYKTALQRDKIASDQHPLYQTDFKSGSIRH